MSMRTCMHGISVSLECDGCKTLDSIESQLAAAKAEIEERKQIYYRMNEKMDSLKSEIKRLREALAEISQCETVEYARIVAKATLDGGKA